MNSNSNYSKLSNQEIKNQLTSINSKYTHVGTTNRTFKQWCGIATADLGGAWAGSWAGGKIGALFGNPGAGAVVGAIIFGAAGSYGVSSPTINGNDNNTNVNTIYNNISVLNDTFTISNPNNNPFDRTVGLMHNKMLKSLTINNKVGGPDSSSTIFDNVDLTADEKTFYDLKKNETIGIYNEMKTSNYSVDATKKMISNNIDDSTLLVIMNSYIDGLNNIQNVSDGINLSYEYENYITNSSSLTDDQKNILLEGLSVGKYSLNFWDKVL